MISKYNNYFKNIQNSMTLYDKTPKKAKILATKEIAYYFKKDMKKFLPSQKFIEKNENGIIFELTYTQPKEILPFIKKWLLNLIILSPNELNEKLKKEIEKYLLY